MLLATPVLPMTVLLVALERFMGVGLFEPTRGGDPLLFQHLFWFYCRGRAFSIVVCAPVVAHGNAEGMAGVASSVRCRRVARSK